MNKFLNRLLPAGVWFFLLATSPLHADWSPPAGFQILEDTLSPDGTMAVTAPDLKHYQEDGPPQNKLVNVHTGDDLATINAPTYFKDPEADMNHADPAPAWSKDGSTLAWVIEGKWAPAVCVLIKVEDGSMAWQTDVLTLVTKRILAKTKGAVPENYAAVKNRSADYGRAYVDGFSVGITVPEGGFRFPWKGQATANSNVKDLTENWPAEANVYATMDFAVSKDGAISYSNFEIDPQQTGVPRGEVESADASQGDNTDATGDSGFSVEEINDSVRDWVKDYVTIESANDLDRLMGTYWETVDYMGDGEMDTDFIRKDKAAYIKQWPTRKVTITGDIEVESKGDDTNWAVTYPTHITLKKKNGDTMSMDALNFLNVTLAGETYAISSQHANLSNKTTASGEDDDAYPGAPASVTAAFIEADGAGLALDGETAPKLLGYTTWTEAPGWDSSTVIGSYEIG